MAGDATSDCPVQRAIRQHPLNKGVCQFGREKTPHFSSCGGLYNCLSIHLIAQNTWNNTIVTLGIGHDTGAEEQLIQVGQIGQRMIIFSSTSCTVYVQALGKENLQFHGADPIQEINMALYSKFGRFYPVAVAGKNGYSSADVLSGMQAFN